MKLWLLDGDKMEEAMQALNVRFQFGTAKDKEQLIVAIETLSRIKADAIKIDNQHRPSPAEEATIEKKKKA